MQSIEDEDRIRGQATVQLKNNKFLAIEKDDSFKLKHLIKRVILSFKVFV